MDKAALLIAQICVSGLLAGLAVSSFGVGNYGLAGLDAGLAVINALLVVARP